MAATFVTLGALSSGATTGTDVVAGANTPGSPVEFTASLSIAAKLVWAIFQVEEGSVAIIEILTGADPGTVRVKVGIGDKGPAAGALVNYCFGPIPVDPAVFAIGTRVAVRAEVDSVVAGNETLEGTLIFCDTALPDLTSWAHNTYGLASGADQKDTTIDPGGTANTKGAWVPLVASAAADIKWAMLMIGNAGNAAAVSAKFLLDLGTGALDAEVVKVANIFISTQTTGDMAMPTSIVLPGDMLASQRIVARAQSDNIDATDRLISVSLLTIAGNQKLGTRARSLAGVM